MFSPFCSNKFCVRLTPEGCACDAWFLSALQGQARVNVHVDMNFPKRRQQVALSCSSHYPPIHTNNFTGFIGSRTHVFSCLILKSKFRSALVDAQPTFWQVIVPYPIPLYPMPTNLLLAAFESDGTVTYGETLKVRCSVSSSLTSSNYPGTFSERFVDQKPQSLWNTRRRANVFDYGVPSIFQ